MRTIADRSTANPSLLTTPEPYLDNVASLWFADPHLARRVEATDTGGPLAVATTARSTRHEVDRDVFAFAVEGVASASRLWNDTGGTEGAALILAWEPDVEALAANLAAAAMPDFVGDPRVRLFVGDDDAVRLGERLAGRSVHLAGGVRRFGETDAFNTFADVLENLAERERTSVNTAVHHGRRTTLNVAGNLRRYTASPGIGGLRNAARGRTGILVSAGPSLRRNVHHLKDAAAAGFVIVAVQTAVKPLLAAGVKPHFVCSLDHSEISTRFMQDLPEDLDTMLVAEAKASPAVLDAWAGKHDRPIALLGNDVAESLVRELRLDRPTLPSGATVAHLAFRLIDWLGCDAAMLVGQDLGFADGLAYAPGTGYDDAWRPETGRFCTFEMKQWEHIARDRAALIQRPDWRGNQAYTEQRLALYLSQFEEMFAQTGMSVIDATEGGMAKQGAISEPLEAACSGWHRRGMRLSCRSFLRRKRLPGLRRRKPSAVGFRKRIRLPTLPRRQRRS